MKILNERGQLHLAMSDSSADMEGYLFKGEDNKSFQKRWFVLKGNLLFYYDKKGDREPAGVIILEGYTVDVSDSMDNFVFIINFSGCDSRTYCLSADSQEAMESWMNALSCAGYGYMKRKVVELQSQLQDVSKTADGLVRDAARDSEVWGQIYSNLAECASPLVDAQTLKLAETRKERISRLSNLSLHQQVEALPQSCQDPKVETVTWSMLGLHSFVEMHQFVKQQIEEYRSESF